MAFNLSDTELKLYFVANTAATASLSTFMVLPPFLLCILCELALIFAKNINAKIHLLLINIFAAEILDWFDYFIFYLGWPARFIYDEDITCKLYVSLFLTTTLLNFASTSQYSVSIYMFVKYGDKKLKWYVIIPCIVITWTVGTILVGTSPYLKEYGISNFNGFCTADALSAAYIVNITILVVCSLFFLSIELICCILSLVHIKRATLEGNTSVKKAVAKVVGYFAVISVLSFINSVLPVFSPIIFRLTIPKSNLATFLTVNYAVRVLPNITAFPTPIVTIILLKPVRDAIKTMSKKVFPCWPKNQVHPATTEEQCTTGITEVSLATNTQNSATLGTQMGTTDKSPTTTGLHEATIEESTL